MMYFLSYRIIKIISATDYKWVFMTWNALTSYTCLKILFGFPTQWIIPHPISKTPSLIHEWIYIKFSWRWIIGDDVTFIQNSKYNLFQKLRKEIGHMIYHFFLSITVFPNCMFGYFAIKRNITTTYYKQTKLESKVIHG